METVLKASSAISGEIVLPRLLRKMMQIISENAGAQTGYLIMEKKGERCIEAEIKTEDEVNKSFAISAGSQIWFVGRINFKLCVSNKGNGDP